MDDSILCAKHDDTYWSCTNDSLAISSIYCRFCCLAAYGTSNVAVVLLPECVSLRREKLLATNIEKARLEGLAVETIEVTEPQSMPLC